MSNKTFMMKVFTVPTISAALFVVSLSVFLLDGHFSQMQCKQALKIQANAELLQSCNQLINKVSWSTWLLNKSKSSQFHFLDLLELLSRQEK